MTTSVLSSNYQIVIPKEVREKLALQPGQRLSIIEKNGRIELIPLLTPTQLIGFLKTDQPLEFERERDREL